MPKIVIIHGPMACGKSTLTEKLRQRFPSYSYVDRPNIKKGLMPAGRTTAKQLSKDASYDLIKELMKIRQNIIVQEINPNSLRKKLARYINQYGYKIIAFYIQCSVQEAIRRDYERSKKRRRSRVKAIHKEFHGPTDMEIIINTESMTVRQSLNLILKHIRSSSMMQMQPK